MLFSLSITCLILTASYVAKGQVSPTASDYLLQGLGNFARNTYWRTCIKSNSAVYSSLSVHAALAIAYMGSLGPTKVQLNETIWIESSLKTSDLSGIFTNFLKNPHSEYQKVLTRLTDSTDVKLNLTIGYFLNKTKILKGIFQNDVSSYYNAQATNYNSSYPGGPEKHIGDLVESKTAGKIKDIVPQGTINASTAMIVVSAFSFEGKWSRQFSESRTKKDRFYRPGGTIQVDTMFDERTINLKMNFSDADIAMLNFTGGRHSLCIVRPRRFSEIRKFENLLAKRVDPNNLCKGLVEKRVNFSLPKFRHESLFLLKEPLEDAGARRAFNITADFGGISGSKPLYMNEFIHKAVIEINEAGVGVAAAKVATNSTAASSQPPPTETFFINCPFFFMIRDNQQGVIVAMGKYSGP